MAAGTHLHELTSIPSPPASRPVCWRREVYNESSEQVKNDNFVVSDTIFQLLCLLYRYY